MTKRERALRERAARYGYKVHRRGKTYSLSKRGEGEFRCAIGGIEAYFDMHERTAASGGYIAVTSACGKELYRGTPMQPKRKQPSK